MHGRNNSIIENRVFRGNEGIVSIEILGGSYIALKIICESFLCKRITLMRSNGNNEVSLVKFFYKFALRKTRYNEEIYKVH